MDALELVIDALDFVIDSLDSVHDIFHIGVDAFNLVNVVINSLHPVVDIFNLLAKTLGLTPTSFTRSSTPVTFPSTACAIFRCSAAAIFASSCVKLSKPP
jgi:hypothetical protein